MPSSKLLFDARYLSKIPDCAQPQEVSIFHSFWEPVGACGLQTMVDPMKIMMVMNLEAPRSVLVR